MESITENVPATKPRLLSIDDLVEMRACYVNGASELEQQISKARRDLLLTQGGIAIIEKMISDLTPKADQETPPTP